MNTSGQNILYTGSDPRALREFIELRLETRKISHASVKAVDWQRVETLSIALFRRNGMDLQSVAWYTMARAWRAGLAGLCEGLEIATAMMKYQWPTLWPHPLPARLAIVTWLSTGIQQFIRSLTFNQDDLPLLLRLKSQLDENVDTLERLAQKHLSQLDWLKVQVGDLIRQMSPPGHELPQVEHQHSQQNERVTDNAIPPAAEIYTPLIYVPRDLTSSPELNVSFSFWERSRGFFAGMMAMALLGSMSIWALQILEPIPNRAQRMTKLAQEMMPKHIIEGMSWQSSASIMALPREQMQLWQLAQYRLQRLSEDLDAMERANSQCEILPELKARVITIQQPILELMPTEELLRKLEKNNTSPELRGLIEHRIRQLLARYALILKEDPYYNDLH